MSDQDFWFLSHKFGGPEGQAYFQPAGYKFRGSHNYPQVW